MTYFHRHRAFCVRVFFFFFSLSFFLPFVLGLLAFSFPPVRDFFPLEVKRLPPPKQPPPPSDFKNGYNILRTCFPLFFFDGPSHRYTSHRPLPCKCRLSDEQVVPPFFFTRVSRPFFFSSAPSGSTIVSGENARIRIPKLLPRPRPHHLGANKTIWSFSPFFVTLLLKLYEPRSFILDG